MITPVSTRNVTGGFHNPLMRNGISEVRISVLIALKYIYFYSSQLNTIPKWETEELKMELKTIIHTFYFHILNIFIPCTVYYFLI